MAQDAHTVVSGHEFYKNNGKSTYIIFKFQTIMSWNFDFFLNIMPRTRKSKELLSFNDGKMYLQFNFSSSDTKSEKYLQDVQ